MNITQYESHGRKLMVEFECQRCRKKQLRSLEECISEVSDFNENLYELNPPLGWRNGGFYYPLFCPDCKKAYEEFMNPGAKLKGGAQK